MSDEIFEEIDLEKNKIIKSNNQISVLETEDNRSEVTDYTSKEPVTNQKNGEFRRESKFYYEFMETNKEFFERIGFKDISNDPIFELTDEVEMKKYVSTNICDICKKEISRIFSKNKFCKFCGCILCDKCSNLKRKIPNSSKKEPSTICATCENKFLNYQIHADFKEKLLNKEFEIGENNQKLEKLSLIYSEQLDEINKQNEIILKRKRENETKEEVLNNETENLRKRTIEICENSEKLTSKINEVINNLKIFDEKKKNLEKDYQNIQKDREDITYEFEKKQTYLNEILERVNSLSISLKNHEQMKTKEIKKETGHKQLDMLLKEKMKSQRKLFEESQNEETTIIINPSKVIKEVYKESLLERENQKKEGAFKRFVLYMGSKIFIKE